MEPFDFDLRTIADVCGVTLRTARGWRQRGQFPLYAERLLRMMLLGDLEPIGGPAWCGWALHRRSGEISAPDGTTWSIDQLSTFYWQMQLLGEYRQQVSRYKRGVPVVDRGEFARLQEAYQVVQRAAKDLGTLMPRHADAGARARGEASPLAGHRLAINY